MTDASDITKERDYKVTKSNLLIQSARSKMTAAEMRLMVYAISKIEMGDKEFKPCEIAIADFCKVCDITPDAQYKNLRNITYRLRSRTIEIFEDEGDTIHQVGWLRKVSYYKGKGKIVLQIDENLAPQLLELKKNFTSYGLVNVLLLKSKYAMQIYELLKSYENIGRWEVDIDDLKRLLFAENYKNFNDFKRFVLEPSIEEINKKTDILADYDLKKQGRKVIGITFSIRQNVENISKRSAEKALRNKVTKFIGEPPEPESDLEIVAEVMGDLGIEKRLTVKEKKAVQKWVSWGYDYEMLHIAFERCIDSTGGVYIPYIDKIIEKWYESDIDTPEGANKELKEFQNQKKTKNNLTFASFDIEEVESAMKQEKALV